MYGDISATPSENEETDQVMLPNVKYRNYRERLLKSGKYNYIIEEM